MFSESGESKNTFFENSDTEFLQGRNSKLLKELLEKKIKEAKKEEERRKKRIKALEKKVKSLPKQILGIENLDKSYHARWEPGDDLLCFPMPARFCIFGRPNSGKTTAIKNIIMRQIPFFEKVRLLHADPRSVEYDDINVEKLTEVPEISEFDPTEKSAFIMEDIAFGKLTRAELENLDRILAYCSTHLQVCPIITAQRNFRIPKNIRDMINVWIIFKLKDQMAIKMIAKQIGLDGNKLCMFINALDEKKHESLWIDETPNSPAPFRFCGYKVIDF